MEEYKKIVIKLLKNEKVSENEINIFIVEYVKQMEGVEVTSEQLTGIKQLLQSGIFSLSYAVREASIKLGINVNTLIDLKTNTRIKMFVYE